MSKNKKVQLMILGIVFALGMAAFNSGVTSYAYDDDSQFIVMMGIWIIGCLFSAVLILMKKEDKGGTQAGTPVVTNQPPVNRKPQTTKKKTAAKSPAATKPAKKPAQAITPMQAATKIATCPNCQQQISVPANVGTLQFDCPTCKINLTVNT